MESAPTRYPHKDASTTSWDRCRSHDQGISASLGQSQGISKHALRRTSYRADTKHLHRTKSVTGTKFAGDRVFGRHEPSRHRGGGSSCSTASTASSTGVSKPWVQGGTYGTGKSFGLSGVDHEAARRKRGEGGPQKCGEVSGREGAEVLAAAPVGEGIRHLQLGYRDSWIWGAFSWQGIRQLGRDVYSAGIQIQLETRRNVWPRQR